MAEIHTLKTLLDQDKESVIELLETALKEARAGEIQAIAVAIVRPSSALNTAWSDNSNVSPLLGAALLLQHRLMRSLGE